MFIYVYSSIRLYIFMSIRLNVYTYICIYVYTSICVYIYMSMHTSMRLYVYTHIYVCLYVYMPMCRVGAHPSRTRLVVFRRFTASPGALESSFALPAPPKTGGPSALRLPPWSTFDAGKGGEEWWDGCTCPVGCSSSTSPRSAGGRCRAWDKSRTCNGWHSAHPECCRTPRHTSRTRPHCRSKRGKQREE